MSTLFAYRPIAGFGNAASREVGDWIEFGIIWDGDIASMPGWEQDSQDAAYHIPGSNRNVLFLLGTGPINRAFTVLCASRTAYAQLAALQQYEGTLRVPAAMNELDVAVETDYSGSLVADISGVVLRSLTGVQVHTDGAVSAQAAFWRSGRT